MPRNSYGEKGHKQLGPQIFVYDGEDAVADGDPDHSNGVDFDLQWYGTMNAEVADIFAKDLMVYKPLV